MTNAPHERQQVIQILCHALLQQFSRGMEQGGLRPVNGYRLRLYFEGMAKLGENISALGKAAALLASSEPRQNDGGHDV